MPWPTDDKPAEQKAVADCIPSATGPTQPCGKAAPKATVVPKIVKVEWLDGSGSGVLAGEGLQFVNLPVDDKWVGGQLATNKRRLGHTPGYKVTFDQPGSHAFKVRLVPAGGNSAYTATEEGRNGNFKVHKEWVSGTTGDQGMQVVVAGPALTVAGGDSYQLEAQDDQATLVKSGSIKTLRALHGVQIKMTGLTATASSIADCMGELAKHHIRLIDLASVGMTRLHNVGTDTAALAANVQTAWNASQGKPKAPYALGMVFTDHLAVKNANKAVSKAVTIGATPRSEVINIVGPGLTDPALSARSLWIDLVPGEGWFVSASYTPHGGTAVPLAEAKLTPVAGGNPKDFDKVKVDLTGLPAGAGTITLTVNWVDRMRGGISLGGMPTVLVCTRAWWVDKSTAAQNQVLVHELGHQFGMVPVGSGSSLDAHSDQYTGGGHVGSHCHNGVPAATNYGSAAATAASACVIFGATNGKLAFCGNCAPQVKKADLSAGWH